MNLARISCLRRESLFGGPKRNGYQSLVDHSRVPRFGAGTPRRFHHIYSRASYSSPRYQVSPSVAMREENTGSEVLASRPVSAPILARNAIGLLQSVLSRPLLLTCITLAVFLMATPDQALARATVEAAVREPSSSGGLLEMAKKAVTFVLHLDVHLMDLVAKYGVATYAIVFAIVFAETGLVVTPFLPGDSLLFATGALAGLGKLNVVALLALYATAATVGDAVNYSGMGPFCIFLHAVFHVSICRKFDFA